MERATSQRKLIPNKQFVCCPSLLDQSKNITISASDDSATVWKNTFEYASFQGHTDSITSLKIFGDMVVSASRNETILWHSRTGSIIRLLEVSTCFDMSSSSLALALDSDTAQVKVYDLSNFECYRTVELPLQKAPINALRCWERHLICAAGSDVVFWDLHDNCCKFQTNISNFLDCPISAIHILGIEECYVVFANDNRHLSVWTLNDNRSIKNFNLPAPKKPQPIKSVAVYSTPLSKTARLLLSDPSWQVLDCVDNTVRILEGNEKPRNLETLYLM